MPEEGAKSSLGWRLLAVGSLFGLALVLALMTFVFLPDIPSARFTGVVRVALSTAAGIREHRSGVAMETAPWPLYMGGRPLDIATNRA